MNLNNENNGKLMKQIMKNNYCIRTNEINENINEKINDKKMKKMMKINHCI